MAARNTSRFRAFPAVERDFSLILNDGTAFAAVRGTIEALGIAEIVSIEAVDLFRGKNVPAGKFSLLVRVTFQSMDGTLTEAQVNEFSARIVAALEQQLGAVAAHVLSSACCFRPASLRLSGGPQWRTIRAAWLSVASRIRSGSEHEH